MKTPNLKHAATSGREDWSKTWAGTDLFGCPGSWCPCGLVGSLMLSMLSITMAASAIDACRLLLSFFLLPALKVPSSFGAWLSLHSVAFGFGAEAFGTLEDLGFGLGSRVSLAFNDKLQESPFWITFLHMPPLLKGKMESETKAPTPKKGWCYMWGCSAPMSWECQNVMTSSEPHATSTRHSEHIYLACCVHVSLYLLMCFFRCDLIWHSIIQYTTV